MEDTKTQTPPSKIMEEYLLSKRKELMFALSKQDYTTAQIGRIFGISRARAHAIIKTMPLGWRTPWIKQIQQQ
jgi:hypothetical protein